MIFIMADLSDMTYQKAGKRNKYNLWAIVLRGGRETEVVKRQIKGEKSFWNYVKRLRLNTRT